jgi:hypothetical protein
MAIKPHVPLDERLWVLRAADHFRNWNSLDDQRVCIYCEKTFTGRQVEIRRGRSGSFHLHCPTEKCSGGPSQWVYPGNPLMSEAAYHDWQRALNHSDSTPAAA